MTLLLSQSFDRESFFLISDFRLLMNILIQAVVRMSLLVGEYFLTSIPNGELIFSASSTLLLFVRLSLTAADIS